jgi:hypothetical protein
MRLPLVSRRRRSKKAQALDMVAGVAKTWSEWQLAKTAVGGVGKGVVVAKAAPRKSLGGLAALAALLVGGLVAVKKLRGGGGGGGGENPYPGTTTDAPGSGYTPPPRQTEPLADPNAPKADNGPAGTSNAFPTAPTSTTEDPGAPAPSKDEPEAPAS